MGDKETPQLDLTAPKYSELFNAVAELQEKLRVLQTSTNSNITPAEPPNVDYRILPDVGTSIWTFTGHESSSQADDWVSSVDGLAHTNQWPLRYRLLYVRSHVSDAARSWYLLEEFRDWDTFVRKFRSTFVRTIRKADLWRELESRVQLPSEPTIDYFYAKIGLCRTLDLSFAETRDYVLEGLRSQQQAEWVSGRVQSDRDELLSDIRDWERLRTKRRQLFPSIVTDRKNNRYDESALQRHGQLVQPRPKTLSESKPVSVDREKSTSKTFNDENPPRTYNNLPRTDITCYNCRGNGHISRDCPKPQRPMKCTCCGSDQHRRNRCPNRETELTPETSSDRQSVNYVNSGVNSIAMRHPKNLYTKTVLVNNTPVYGSSTRGVQTFSFASRSHAEPVLRIDAHHDHCTL